MLGNPDAVKTLARNSGDDELLEKFRETASIWTTKHWRSFVHLEQFSKLLSGKGKALNIHSGPDALDCERVCYVLIAGANFEDTGLYAHWSKMGVRLETDTGVADGLRYRTHANGKRCFQAAVFSACGGR